MSDIVTVIQYWSRFSLILLQDKRLPPHHRYTHIDPSHQLLSLRLARSLWHWHTCPAVALVLTHTFPILVYDRWYDRLEWQTAAELSNSFCGIRCFNYVSSANLCSFMTPILGSRQPQYPTWSDLNITCGSSVLYHQSLPVENVWGYITWPTEISLLPVFIL